MIPQITSPDPARSPAPAVWQRDELERADGTRIALFRTGRTDPGAPTYVLVHGMGHWTQAAWDFVAGRLGETHRVVGFDLPGFGDSDKPNVAYTLAFFTAALADVVASLGVRRVALAGHSLGGLIAANYAAAAPARVASLALIDPAGFLRTPKLVLKIAGSRPVAWLMRAVRPSRAFVRRTFAGAVFDPATVPEAYHERAFALARDRRVVRAFAGVYRHAMRDLLNMRELHLRLAAYRGSVMLVWGENDRYVPVSGLAVARNVFPHADVLRIPRCGHCPTIEFPALVAERLATFAPGR